MSTKDYIAIGGKLAAEWAISNHSLHVWNLTLSIADVFAQDSERFDRAKFYEYVFGSDQWAARERISA